ncbi:hypothetical protein F5Y03DRAFT_389796 [Xylaria venustula]|nr:hypothetical protein F5Y03DRAFT_389796 [Xylaria venustula]
MQRTPPPKLPPRPMVAVSTYKTLPDASKADLPPKPATTPKSLSPTMLHFPRAALTPETSPESQRRFYGQKRKYPYSDDNNHYPVLLPTTPTPKRIRYTYNYHHGRNYDGIDDIKEAKHFTNIQQATPTNTGPHGGIYSHHQTLSVKPTYQGVHYSRKYEPKLLEIQLIHDKLLGGATSLTKKEQNFLQYQMNNNPVKISALMVTLIVKQVTNKTSGLSYGIMHWANRKNEPGLLEEVLTDWLYNFDVDEAFNEGLMSVQEASNLMDCQIVLECIRRDRIERARHEKPERECVGPDADSQYDSDARSQSMDLSDTE